MENPFGTSVSDVQEEIWKLSHIAKIVCAWCPDKEERTKRLQDEGKTVSHGICPECSEKYDWK